MGIGNCKKEKGGGPFIRGCGKFVLCFYYANWKGRGAKILRYAGSKDCSHEFSFDYCIALDGRNIMSGFCENKTVAVDF